MVPDFLVRFVLWMLTHTLFRIRIVGQENVPFRGPALLVVNHMSHVDGFLIGACVQRFIRFMVWKPYYEIEALNWFFRRTKAIPVGAGRRAIWWHPSARRGRNWQPATWCASSPKAPSAARATAAVQARHGEDRRRHWMCPSFPCISTGCGAASSASSGGSFFWKWPKRVPYPGDRLVRQALAVQRDRAGSPAGHSGTCGSDAVAHRKTRRDLLDRRFIRTARQNWSASPWRIPPAAN